MRHLLDPNPRRARDSTCNNLAACNTLISACSTTTACTQQDARVQNARAEPHPAHIAPCRDRRPNFSAPPVPRAALDSMLHSTGRCSHAMLPCSVLALFATSGARLQGRPSRRVFARRPCSRCSYHDLSLTHHATNINARLCRKRYKREPSFAEGPCPQAPSSSEHQTAAPSSRVGVRALADQATPVPPLPTVFKSGGRDFESYVVRLSCGECVMSLSSRPR